MLSEKAEIQILSLMKKFDAYEQEKFFCFFYINKHERKKLEFLI